MHRRTIVDGMNRILTRRTVPASQPSSLPEWVPPLYRRSLPSGQRACCCSAVAVYEAVLAPNPDASAGRELLLCGHHACASWASLSAQGAALYDADGQLVELVHGQLTVAAPCRALPQPASGRDAEP